MDTKSDCASHQQSLLRDQLASEVRSAEHGQRFTEERTPLAVDLNVGVNLVGGQDKHGEVYVSDCSIVPALSMMLREPGGVRRLRLAPVQARQPSGSSEATHPRIRAAEAHSFPSYDPETWLTFDGGFRSVAPGQRLPRSGGRKPVADNRQPKGGNRLTVVAGFRS